MRAHSNPLCLHLASTIQPAIAHSILMLTRQDYLGPNHAPGSPPSTHVRDVRLSLIDARAFSFRAKRCLDVGCNDGAVGTQLGMYARGLPCSLLQPIITWPC